jgi:hypothetical protein
MFDRLMLDSSNSSIQPSSDPNRKKDSKENDENESDSNTPGGQLGHPGKTRLYAAIATVEHQTIKHQFSHVQELIERFFKIQREAGFCFD